MNAMNAYRKVRQNTIALPVNDFQNEIVDLADIQNFLFIFRQFGTNFGTTEQNALPLACFMLFGVGRRDTSQTEREKWYRFKLKACDD